MPVLVGPGFEQAGMKSKPAAIKQTSDSPQSLRRRRPEAASPAAINPRPGKVSHRPFSNGRVKDAARGDPLSPFRPPGSEAPVGGGVVGPVVVMVSVDEASRPLTVTVAGENEQKGEGEAKGVIPLQERVTVPE